MIESVYSNGTYTLAKPDGEVMMAPINSKFLIKYYPWEDHFSSSECMPWFKFLNLKEDTPIQQIQVLCDYKKKRNFGFTKSKGNSKNNSSCWEGILWLAQLK